jgi:hypothetical protein
MVDACKWDAVDGVPPQFVPALFTIPTVLGIVSLLNDNITNAGSHIAGSHNAFVLKVFVFDLTSTVLVARHGEILYRAPLTGTIVPPVMIYYESHSVMLC